jgi:hypothetical protein
MLVGAVLTLGWASSAWPQSSYYFPRYIAQPFMPTSYEACDALREDYNKEADRVSKAHNDCLKTNSNTARGDEHGTCAHPRCQGLHDQQGQISQKRSTALDKCRNDVSRHMESKRRDEANRQAAEAEQRAREADQHAREDKRRDEQQRREREAEEAERKRDERREQRNLARKGLEVQRDVGKIKRAVKDPLGALERKVAGKVGDAEQDAIGASFLGDYSRDPEKGSDHEVVLDQADALNRMRLRSTNPFAYAASDAALHHAGRVQAGALEQWDKATGDSKALRIDTPTSPNPFANTIRPLPGPGSSPHTAEVAPAGASSNPFRGTPPTDEVLAGSGAPSRSPAPSANPLVSSTGTQSTSGSMSIASNASPATETAAKCFFQYSSNATVCLGVPNDLQRERACWQQEGTIMCPPWLYERERLRELGQRPSH